MVFYVHESYVRKRRSTTMAIKSIGASDSNSKFHKKIATASGVGLVGGTIYSSTQKNWLYKGMPSDRFIKTVSEDLQQRMSSDELKESSKINKFLQSVVNPQVNFEELKPQIRNSKELTDAIKATPEEPLENAFVRVFSKQNKAELRQDLLNLQYKTHSDKLADTNTALKLVHDNFDAKSKKLQKTQGTADEVFNIIKKSASKIQKKAVIATGVMAGIVTGSLCLIATDIPNVQNKK
jgi:hypothetical protein